jgi:transcriptional regulator with GAF, ATPase, and Fis domain
MDIARATQALAEASSSLTRAHDVVGSLSALLESCKTGLGADVGGVLVTAPGGGLELLVPSSHRAAELEMHQLNVDDGPCLEAFDTHATVQEHSADRLRERWPSFAPAMLDAGLLSVHAAPLTWHGEALGAMGLFRRSGTAFTPDEDAVVRAFADIATLLVLDVGDVDPSMLADRLTRALDARIVVEQAKGVLSEQLGLDTAGAYERLVRDAIDRGRLLASWAADVVVGARRPAA